MKAIEATWTNGKIVPSEPVDWPEGSKLLVEPVRAAEAIGMTEAQWSDDPESIANWVAAVRNIPPMIWGPGEREEYERYRQECRDFNLEAVRRQMHLTPKGDAV